MSNPGLLDEARTLISKSEFASACALLERAGNDDPEILCELATLYCYLQREDEAVPLMERCKEAEGFGKLGLLLRRYFICRELMAAKLGIKDAKGKALGLRVKALYPIKPKECGISLSACLIVRDEQKHLDRCLKSLAKHVDEIVVVDTGSKDKTISIAKANGAKIGNFNWCDDFAEARNESLKLATSHWILWIDADETVDASSWNAISEGLIRPQFGGYHVQIVNYMDEGCKSQYVHSPVRLFQRLPGVRFEGRIHEQVVQSFEKLGLPCATLENVKLMHYGYQPSDMQEKGKAERAIRMLEREVEEAPKDPFHWFNLANAYSVAKRKNDAVRAAKKCLENIKPGNAFASLAYQILAGNLTMTGRAQEALEVCTTARDKNCFTILNGFEAAHALFRLGKLQDALLAADACVAMEWPAGMTGDYGIVTHKTLVLKGQILSAMGRFREAEECLDKALSVDPKFGVAVYAMGTNKERQKKFQEAIQYFRRGFDDPDLGHACLRAAAAVSLSLGDTETAKRRFRDAWLRQPLDLECWAQWTYILENQGNPKATLEAYETFAKHHEPTVDVLVNWGRAKSALGDDEEALALFKKAVELGPSDANALFNLGDQLVRCAQYLDAAQAYETALRLQPSNAEGWFVLGNALAYAGSVEGARLAYAQTLTLSPGHPGARHNLGTIGKAA